MRNLLFFALPTGFVASVLLGPFLSAQSVETSRDLKAALSRPAIQKKLEDCDFARATSKTINGIQMTTDPGGAVSLSGKDHSGSLWKATYEAMPGAGCQLWKVDLGRNGGLDLAFLAFGGDSSGGWDTTLSLLLFNGQGLPFPWQATSMFHVTDLGIKELVLLGDERLPAVIIGSPTSTDAAGRASPEYHAFQFVADRASEIVGKQGNIAWPILSTRNTPYVALAKSSLSTNDSPNVAPETSHISFVSLLGNPDSERRLHLSSEDIAVPKVLVIDANGTRQIISAPGKADLLKLKAGETIKAMLGQDCDGDQCSPIVLWVSE